MIRASDDHIMGCIRLECWTIFGLSIPGRQGLWARHRVGWRRRKVVRRSTLAKKCNARSLGRRLAGWRRAAAAPRACVGATITNSAAMAGCMDCRPLSENDRRASKQDRWASLPSQKERLRLLFHASTLLRGGGAQGELRHGRGRRQGSGGGDSSGGRGHCLERVQRQLLHLAVLAPAREVEELHVGAAHALAAGLARGAVDLGLPWEGQGGGLRRGRERGG